MPKLKRVEKIAIVCEKIEKRDGILTPQAVVDEAKSPTCLIHDMFDWNDMSASEKYRLGQARKLIKEVTITYENKEIHSYQNVLLKIRNQQVQGYASTVNILQNDDLRKQVIAKALQELLYWQAEYAKYKELADLVDANKLNQLSKKHKAK